MENKLRFFREKAVLIFIFILALSIRLFISKDYFCDIDVFTYLRMADEMGKWVSQGNYTWYSFTGIFGANYYPLLYPATGLFISKLFGNLEHSLVLVSVFSGSLLIFPVYYFVKRYFNLRAAILSALLTAVYPALVFHSSIGLSESLFLLFFMCGVFLTFKNIFNFNLKHLIGLGLLWGIAYYVRVEALLGYFLSAFLIFSRVFGKNGEIGFKKGLAYLLIYFSSFLLIITPYLFYLYKLDGELELIPLARTKLHNIELSTDPGGERWTKEFFYSVGIGGEDISKYPAYRKLDRVSTLSLFQKKVYLLLRWSPYLVINFLQTLRGCYFLLFAVIAAAALIVYRNESLKYLMFMALTGIPGILEPTQFSRYYLPIVLVSIIISSLWVCALYEGEYYIITGNGRFDKLIVFLACPILLALSWYFPATFPSGDKNFSINILSEIICQYRHLGNNFPKVLFLNDFYFHLGAFIWLVIYLFIYFIGLIILYKRSSQKPRIYFHQKFIIYVMLFLFIICFQVSLARAYQIRLFSFVTTNKGAVTYLKNQKLEDNSKLMCDHPVDAYHAGCMWLRIPLSNNFEKFNAEIKKDKPDYLLYVGYYEIFYPNLEKNIFELLKRGIIKEVFQEELNSFVGRNKRVIKIYKFIELD